MWMTQLLAQYVFRLSYALFGQWEHLLTGFGPGQTPLQGQRFLERPGRAVRCGAHDLIASRQSGCQRLIHAASLLLCNGGALTPGIGEPFVDFGIALPNLRCFRKGLNGRDKVPIRSIGLCAIEGRHAAREVNLTDKLLGFVQPRRRPQRIGRAGQSGVMVALVVRD